MTQPEAVRLTRRDLIRYEHLVKDTVSRFISFRSYSIYFPKAQAARNGEYDPGTGQALYLPEEKRLFLPLLSDGKLLGIFMAKGVRLSAPKAQQPLLKEMAALCMDNLRLSKASITDPLTGLFNRHHFIQSLEREITRVQNCILPESGTCLDPGLCSFSGRLGIFTLEIDRFRSIAEKHGFLTADRIAGIVAEVIREESPEQIVPCRVGEGAFALLWPGGTIKDCAILADAIRLRVRDLAIDLPASEKVLRITLSCGVAGYPSDLKGAQITLSVPETARLLLSKAEKAASVAREQGRDQVFSFDSILEQGGSVLEMLPTNRFTVNLGKNVDAQEGQRFLIWPPRFLKEIEIKRSDSKRLLSRYPTMYKGEAIIIDVQEDTAVAEILHLNDSAWEIEQGDRLTLLDEPGYSGTPQKTDDASRMGQPGGLFNYTDFISHLSRARADTDAFGITLMRITHNGTDTGGDYRSRIEKSVEKLAGLAAETLGKDAVGGRYSLNSLSFFVPDRTADSLHEATKELCNRAAELDVTLAVGTAGYPYLAFSKTDVFENCRKALNHALLLDPPKPVLFDSVSLNVSADRLFARGDIYGAIEEYKLSLLADETNNLSRNSLAVCFARIGRMEQAADLFLHVVENDPGDLMALYNYGFANLHMKDYETATGAFRQCLELNPDHIFSLIRLGQIAERQNDLDTAEAYYHRASELDGGEPMTARHMARLAIGKNDTESAREHLHRAITHNPADDQSIYLLAKIYLDSGEDPEIAEALARQAAELRSRTQYWQLLSRALEACGRPEDAKTALVRAERL